MPHKHWPADHPAYGRAPWCDLPTKKACDERWTTYLHNHFGEPCRKRVEPGNQIATCYMRRPVTVGSLSGQGSKDQEPTELGDPR